MSVAEEAQHKATCLATQGASTEEILELLRQSGCSMGDAVIVLAEVRGIDQDEAQRQVVLSKVWEDRYEAYTKLETSFWDAAESLGERQADGSTKIDLSRLRDW